METAHKPRDLESMQERCPLTAALEVVGGKWNMIVLYWLSSGTRRFNGLRRLMPNVSHKVLAATLRDLEQAQLIERTVHAEVPPRVEYSISAHGRTVVPLVEAVRVWGHLHLDQMASVPDLVEPA